MLVLVRTVTGLERLAADELAQAQHRVIDVSKRQLIIESTDTIVANPPRLADDPFLIPAAVTDPIRLHVEAKRYLCAVDPAYRDCLSAGSKRSLLRQGGPLAPDEVVAFEALPGATGAVALRRWDDAGKVAGLAVPELAAYEPMLRSVAL